jgi:hypothetical protein
MCYFLKKGVSIMGGGFLPKALVNRTLMFILLHPVGPEITESVSKKGKKR